MYVKHSKLGIQCCEGTHMKWFGEDVCELVFGWNWKEMKHGKDIRAIELHKWLE